MKFSGFTLAELKELKSLSTKVNSWYFSFGSVRGPFNRWFEVTQVPKDCEKHVAYASDDARFCAAAMNATPELVEYVEKQQKALAVAKEALRAKGLQSTIRKMEDITGD